MDVRLIFRDKYIYADGAIREMVIWRLPQSAVDSERPYRLKYRLFYGFAGQCLVRYDNELGKGDHRHYQDREESYRFISVEQLVGDFRADIRRLRGHGHD